MNNYPAIVDFFACVFMFCFIVTAGFVVKEIFGDKDKDLK